MFRSLRPAKNQGAVNEGSPKCPKYLSTKAMISGKSDSLTACQRSAKGSTNRVTPFESQKPWQRVRLIHTVKPRFAPNVVKACLAHSKTFAPLDPPQLGNGSPAWRSFTHTHTCMSAFSRTRFNTGRGTPGKVLQRQQDSNLRHPPGRHRHRDTP